MEKQESNKSNIKRVGKLLIRIILGLIIILFLGVLLLCFIIKKDSIEYDKFAKTNIEQIKYLFESEGNFEACPHSLYTYTSSGTNEIISILLNDEIYFQYYKPGQQILFYGNTKTAQLNYFGKEEIIEDGCKLRAMPNVSEAIYTIDLIKKDPEGGYFLENPDNYRITNITYNTGYNESITGETEFKITDNLILKRNESLINKQ